MNIQIHYKIAGKLVKKSKSRIIFNIKNRLGPPPKKKTEVKMIKSFKIWQLVAEKN